MESYWNRTGPESNVTDVLIRSEVMQMPGRENAMWLVGGAERGATQLSAKEQQALTPGSQKSQGRI